MFVGQILHQKFHQASPKIAQPMLGIAVLSPTYVFLDSANQYVAGLYRV
jgi:hypothetical protein